MEYRDATHLGKTVGSFVAKLREENKLNRSQLSKKVNLPRSSLFNIEKGLPANMTSVDTILKAFDMSWSDLARYLDEETQNG